MLMQVVEPMGIFFLALAALLLVRFLVVRFTYRRTAPSSSYRILLDTVRIPSFFWCLAAALVVGMRFANLTRAQSRQVVLWVVIFLIVSLTLVTSSLLVRLLAAYGERQGILLAHTGLARMLTHTVVLGIGAMFLLRYLGVSILPILTAFGVTGLAVALAMRDELANFFAGVYILLETPYTVGDHIMLATGEEGRVIDIGWRTTRLVTGGSNILVIPNAKVTTTVLTNLSLPTPVTNIDIALVAGLEADPRRVADLAIEEAASLPGVLPEPPPVVRFDPGVLPTHLQFKLQARVSEPALAGAIKSELRLRILNRFRLENVPLPKVERVSAEREI